MATVTQFQSSIRRKVFVLREEEKGLYAYQPEVGGEQVITNSADQYFDELREAGAVLVDVSRFQNPGPEILSGVINLRAEGYRKKARILYCGSAMKGGKAIAIPLKEDGSNNDILCRDWKLLKDVGKIVYTGPYFQGTPYGAAAAKDLKVWIVPVGTVFAGRVIDDGNMIISGTVFDQMTKDHGGSKVVYRKQGRSSWMTAYLLDTANDPLWGEIKPLLVKQIDRANAPANMRNDLLDEHKFREELCQLQPMLSPGDDSGVGSHPYFTHFLVRQAQEDLRRNVMSIHWENIVTRVMMPPIEGQETDLVLPDGSESHSKSVVIGFPVQGTECMMAVDNVLLPEGDGTQVAQLRLMGREIFVKGMAERRPDDLMEGYDIVCCAENIKMASNTVEYARRPHVEVFDELFVLVTQVYGEDQICRVPKTLAELLKRDYDGDLLQFVPGVTYPELFAEVWGWPRYEAAKVKKEKSWIKYTKKEVIDLRWLAMSIMCTNFIGWATTMAAIVWSMPDEVQKPIIADQKLTEPDLINQYYPEYMSTEPTEMLLALKVHMDSQIQIGTDVFKVWQAAQGLREHLSRLQTLLRGRDNANWDAPHMRAAIEAWFARGGDESGPVFYDDDGLNIFVDPRFKGMVNEIIRFTMPMIQFPEEDPAEPLARYLNWVAEPDRDTKAAVGRFYSGWFDRANRINLDDDDEFQQFKIAEQAEFEREFVHFRMRTVWRHLPKGNTKDEIEEILFLERPFSGLVIARRRVEAVLAMADDIPEGQAKALKERLGEESFLEFAAALWYFTHAAERSGVKHHGTAPFWAIRKEVLMELLKPERVDVHIKANVAQADRSSLRLIGVNYTMKDRVLDNPFKASVATVIVSDRKRKALIAEGFETGADVSRGFPRDQVGLFDLNDKRSWLLDDGDVYSFFWREVKSSSGAIDVTAMPVID
jgi:hypothetical protein